MTNVLKEYNEKVPSIKRKIEELQTSLDEQISDMQTKAKNEFDLTIYEITQELKIVIRKMCKKNNLDIELVSLQFPFNYIFQKSENIMLFSTNGEQYLVNCNVTKYGTYINIYHHLTYNFFNMCEYDRNQFSIVNCHMLRGGKATGFG